METVTNWIKENPKKAAIIAVVVVAVIAGLAGFGTDGYSGVEEVLKDAG